MRRSAARTRRRGRCRSIDHPSSPGVIRQAPALIYEAKPRGRPASGDNYAESRCLLRSIIFKERHAHPRSAAQHSRWARDLIAMTASLPESCRRLREFRRIIYLATVIQELISLSKSPRNILLRPDQQSYRKSQAMYAPGRATQAFMVAISPTTTRPSTLSVRLFYSPSAALKRLFSGHPVTILDCVMLDLSGSVSHFGRLGVALRTGSAYRRESELIAMRLLNSAPKRGHATLWRAQHATMIVFRDGREARDVQARWIRVRSSWLEADGRRRTPRPARPPIARDGPAGIDRTPVGAIGFKRSWTTLLHGYQHPLATLTLSRR